MDAEELARSVSGAPGRAGVATTRIKGDREFTQFLKRAQQHDPDLKHIAWDLDRLSTEAQTDCIDEVLESLSLSLTNEDRG